MRLGKKECKKVSTNDQQYVCWLSYTLQSGKNDRSSSMVLAKGDQLCKFPFNFAAHVKLRKTS